ncbi:RNA polymerase sigma factor [Persicitalea jodogahamensis]|uniref:RNA polymerase sigma factor n=1 Tax=Persicitalea jodogahamensis TaxID=402147 RepID=A0A8J3DCK5_9BACT|nr:RNA polymerase sigma factor [Persicitalea jodogahamensis]GHB76894.1 RNA polymerase sigma factor [Persicitalea jodogahamensis]
MNDARFEEIYEEFKGLVYNLALSYIHNQEDAQDITQEVFVKIYQRYGSYDADKSSLKTWVYQITINHCLDFLKAQKAQKRFGFLTGLFSPITNEPIAEASHFDHPGVALEDKEEVQRLFSIIDTLPDNQRTALILTKIEDRSVKEVADIMSLTPKAVESLVQRAKNNFSKKSGRTEGF